MLGVEDVASEGAEGPASVDEAQRLFADTLPVICWSSDPDGRLRWLNRRWDEYAGCFPDLDAEMRWQAARGEELAQPRQAGFASGEPFQWVDRLRGKDGEARLFLAQAQPQRGRNGQLTGWLGICSEVTEQVESERLQAFLLRLGDLTRAESDPERILAITSEAVGRELEADRVVYGTIDWDEGVMHMGADWRSDGASWAAHRVPLTAYSREHIEAHTRGDAIWVANVEEEPQVSPAARERFRAAGVEAFASVPLVKDGQARAIMTAQQFRIRQWTRYDVRLLSEVAERTWATVERAKSQAHLSRMERQRSFLLAMSDRLRGESDPMRVLALSAQSIGEFLKVRDVIFSEIDDAGTHLCSLRSWSDGTVPPRVARLPLKELGERLLEAYHGGQTRVVSDVSNDLDLPEVLRANVRKHGIASYITVPVLSERGLIGSLSVQSAGQREWLDEEVELVEAVAERSWEALGRARAAVALRDSEQLFRSVIEAHPIAVAIVQNGRLVLVNPAGEALLGIDAPANTTQAHGHNSALEESWRLIGPIVEAEADGDAREAELRRRGVPVPVSLSWRAILYRGAPAVIVSFIDLTEAKRGEAELVRSREALAQSEKLTALGSLLAGVSHELNNPLSIVVGESILLEEDTEGTSLAQSAMRIRKAAERCSRIVQTFLAMARQKPPERLPVDVAAVCKSALELTQYSMRSNGIQVRTDFSPELPLVAADSDQLHQVIVNLLINAQQALQERDAPREIRLATRHNADERRVCIEVSDNGPGIKAEVAKRIFEPFFTTKPQGAGTGLGLSFSHGVIAAHDGNLSLSDKEGGATFLIELPSRVPTSPSAVLDERKHRTGSGRALIVDDEPDLAKALASFVAREGYETVVASTGREAIDLANSQAFDVILSDLRMPDLDGPAFHRWLVEHRPNLSNRLGFVTGDTLGAAAVRFLQNAARPFVEKPFSRESIRQLLSDLRK